MLGRQVGTSLLRLPRCTRLPIRSIACQQLQHDLAIRTLAPSTCRFYAQITPSRPGRPKKAVGEPSKPVKRSVERAAKSPKEDAATKKVKARKETAQKKTKKAATGTRGKKKKEVSEEEKAKLAERTAKRKATAAAKLQKANVAELKKLALDPPKVHQFTLWTIYQKERLQASEDLKGLTPAQLHERFGEKMRNTRDEYRNITPAEKEHYNHLVHTTKEREQAAYKAYVESYTIEEIEAANKARRRLRAQEKKATTKKTTKASKWAPIKDERAVKQPLSPYLQFNLNRWGSGDFRNIKAVEASKLIAQEWKALAEDEKKKYKDLYKQDAGRYVEEYTSVHGHSPPTYIEPPAQAAAAAA